MYKCHDSTILTKWFSVRNCVIRSDFDKLLRTINHHWNYTTRIVISLSKVRERENRLSSFFFFFFNILSISNVSFCVLVSFVIFLSFFFFFYVFLSIFAPFFLFLFFFAASKYEKFIFDHSICIHTCIHTLTYMYIHIYSRRSTWVARIGWQDRLF